MELMTSGIAKLIKGQDALLAVWWDDVFVATVVDSRIPPAVGNGTSFVVCCFFW